MGSASSNWGKRSKAKRYDVLHTGLQMFMVFFFGLTLTMICLPGNNDKSPEEGLSYKAHGIES